MSNLEPVLLKISEASDRVMKNQKESAGEYMAVHRYVLYCAYCTYFLTIFLPLSHALSLSLSIMGLEMAVRDMDRSDEEDSDDEQQALKGTKKISHDNYPMNF